MPMMTTARMLYGNAIYMMAANPPRATQNAVPAIKRINAIPNDSIHFNKLFTANHSYKQNIHQKQTKW
mgnify:CR=1 FL=1